MTDLVAHRGDDAAKRREARRVEALVDATLDAVNLAHHRVVVTSDHGNLEQADHKRHTTNPVPLLCWGLGAQRFVERARDLADVAPAILAAAARER